MKTDLKKPTILFTPPEYLKKAQSFFKSVEHYNLSQEDYKKLLQSIRSIENASRSIHQLNYIFRNSLDTSLLLIGFERTFADNLTSNILNKEIKLNHNQIKVLQNRLLHLKNEMASSYPTIKAGLHVFSDLFGATVGILGISLGIGIITGGSLPLIVMGIALTLLSSIMTYVSVCKAHIDIRYCSNNQINDINNVLDLLSPVETGLAAF